MEQFTFYEWYADILQNMDDISAGKLANCICAYEFEDREPVEELSVRESFYWSNIEDILKEVKETESIRKMPKKYNLQSKHFTFYETYYKAMKLMNIKKQGIFVKAICAYMFGNEEPKFEDRTMQGYFNLCKRKLDVSKKRKSSGRRGGAQKKKVCAVSPIEDSTPTPQGIQADAPQEKLTEKIKLRFAEQRLGINRIYQSKQAQVEIVRMIRVPVAGTVSPQDVALLEGKQYRIDTVQKVMEIYPPCVDLALAKIEQEFEVMA